jgi:hypothetical protein
MCDWRLLSMMRLPRVLTPNDPRHRDGINSRGMLSTSLIYYATF